MHSRNLFVLGFEIFCQLQKHMQKGLLIKKGQVVRKIPESDLLAVLREELSNWNEA